MAETPIEWAWPPGYRGATWNPIDGCWPVSPGCAHCYAATMARRIVAMGGKAAERYRLRVVHKDGEPVAKWNGTFGEVPQLLDLPLRTKAPTCFFVNSMSDLFGEGVSDEYIAAVFGVMAACPQHRFIVLTKRAERMARWFEWISQQSEARDQWVATVAEAERKSGDPIGSRGAGRVTVEEMAVHEYATRAVGAAYSNRSRPPRVGLYYRAWPLPNVWIGVSVEDQQRADERIPHLLRVPAAVRFLSMEPLLEAVDVETFLSARICTAECAADPGGCDHDTAEPALHWVIVGGESGPGARPMHPDWARSLRNQCAEAGVPFFFKQWGAWQNGSTHFDPRFKKLSPKRAAALNRVVLTNGDAVVDSLPEIEKYIRQKDITSGDYMRMHPTAMALVGKKAAGALLDGQMHREWPEAA